MKRIYICSETLKMDKTTTFTKGKEYVDKREFGDSLFIDDEGDDHGASENFRSQYFKLKN